MADPRPALRAVHVPALVLRAEGDYKKWAVTYDYKRTLPEATLLYLKGAGHAISSDKPALYLSLIRAFLLDRPLPLPAWNSADPPR
ncbi:alpha/beta hydrolase [Micromonospora sp. CPCC 205371]|nr:alpha/beta hydrolase [Micromonospora sp. CPCC 205371]